MCNSCRARAEELRKKRRQQRQQLGICNRCGKNKVIAGTKYCIECANKAKKHKDSEETKEKRLKKYHEVYKSQLHAKRIEFKENGLCADCGKQPPRFGVVCEDCYAKRRKWYSQAKLRGLSKTLCSGDCINCMLPWCIDNDDSDIKTPLTKEEKQLSKQLDKEATADERRWAKDLKREIKNAKHRYTYAQSIIADVESRREQGEEITSREEQKVLNAEKRAAEARTFIEKHSSGFISL